MTLPTDVTTRAANTRATVLVVLAVAGFGAIAIFTTFGTGAGAPLLTILSWRYVIATAVLVPIAWSVGAIRRIDRAGLRILLYGGVGQAIIAVVTLVSLRYIPAATLAFLFYTYPGWVAILARVRHSEPLTPARLTALALSLAGIFVMVGAPGAAVLHPIGVTLALVGAFLYAIYVPMIAELQRNVDSVATAAFMSAGAGISLVIVALIRREFVVAMHTTAWVAVLGLAIISTVGAFLLFLRGLRVLGAVRTAIISTVEPFFTALMGAWLLAQPLGVATMFGGALIAVAVVLLQLPTANNSGTGRS